MLQTLTRRDNIAELTARYGLVIVDECHHIPAAAFEHAVKQIEARRWLGLTATPYRRDQLDDLIHLQMGPVRHTMTAVRAGTPASGSLEVPPPEPVLIVHPTRFRYVGDADPSAPGGMSAIYRDLVADDDRTRQVVGDVVAALDRGRHCLVLTQWTSHVTRHPWSRLGAMLADWFCILAWVAITAAFGVPLYLSGATHPGVLASNLVAALMTVVPATVVLALLESSAREASIGKRARHLRVVDAATGSRVSFRRSILRNTLKIGVPWTIGHAAVFSIVQASGSGSVPVAVWLPTIVAYVFPIMYIVFLFVGRGRTPYDLISGTIVIQEIQAGLDRSAAGRRGVRSRRAPVGRAPQPRNR